MEVGQKVYAVKDCWKGPTLMETEVERIGKKELRLKYHMYFKTRYPIDTKFCLSPEEAWTVFRDEVLIKVEYQTKLLAIAHSELKKLGGTDIIEEKRSEEKERSEGVDRVL